MAGGFCWQIVSGHWIALCRWSGSLEFHVGQISSAHHWLKMRNGCLHTYYKFTSYYYIFKFENEWNMGIHAFINTILYTYTIIHIYCMYYLCTVKKIRHNILTYRMCIYIYICITNHRKLLRLTSIHPSLPTHPTKCSPCPSFSSASLACATPWGRRNTRRFQLLYVGQEQS